MILLSLLEDSHQRTHSTQLTHVHNAHEYKKKTKKPNYIEHKQYMYNSSMKRVRQVEVEEEEEKKC